MTPAQLALLKLTTNLLIQPQPIERAQRHALADALRAVELEESDLPPAIAELARRLPHHAVRELMEQEPELSRADAIKAVGRFLDRHHGRAAGQASVGGCG